MTRAVAASLLALVACGGSAPRWELADDPPPDRVHLWRYTVVVDGEVELDGISHVVDTIATMQSDGTDACRNSVYWSFLATIGEVTADAHLYFPEARTGRAFPGGPWALVMGNRQERWVYESGSARLTDWGPGRRRVLVGDAIRCGGAFGGEAECSDGHVLELTVRPHTSDTDSVPEHHLCLLADGTGPLWEDPDGYPLCTHVVSRCPTD